jgi:hypothetical protein
MTGAQTLAVRAMVQDYVARIEVHLARLAAGHDPKGHLFGIERLARGARTELTGARRWSEQGQPRP